LSRSRRSRAGFTLIEVLVALAVVAASLAAIGALMAVSMQNVRAIDRRLEFRETLRAIMTSLPDQRDLAAGSTTGSTAGYRWRIDIAPLASEVIDAPTRWEPDRIVITVESPSGQRMRIDTIRLQRRPG